MSRRPFFVGVGAQRAGTTWIGHFLRRLPDIRFSPIKEVCYFDAKHVEARKRVISEAMNTRLAVLGLGNYTRKHPLSGLRLCYHYLGIRKLSDDSYRAFFDELARSGAVAGEISPSYAMLDEDAVRHMDALLDQPNVFFVMRNPVDRLLSQYSFLSTRPGLKAPGGTDLTDALCTLCGQSFHVNYPRSLKTYRAVLPEDRFKTFFTEHLFDPARTQAQCDALCDYLGIGRSAVPSDRPVNRAPAVEISLETRAILAGKLAKSYSAARAIAGEDLPLSWQRDLALIDQT
ncbi:sulfotransferase [Roseobacter sinensis]|uniref:Sulfotransferase n=1 Tax=Roseobacter sinensis TaxID=2931391 RepID=A0ABT3BIK2_9RHOB|nr:sulfotransferase [Roseobacter sp. WL0113]MCV3273401.1 sulfotransferase [Roseobacter sp. WL0113]